MVRVVFHRSTPPQPASGLQSLPPILHKPHRIPIPNYSEGPGGLSVLLRVTSIFTRNAISPSSWLRQRGNRYAIRAGRNLPDKEFRYLRTVIVTAAVYWGFNSPLHPQSGLTGPLNLPAQASVRIHRLTSSHGPVFLPNSRFSLASATTTQHIPEQRWFTGMVPFSRSYGAMLPSSQHDSLEHLRILSSTTCVGYRARATHLTSMLSRQQRITRSPHQCGAPISSHKCGDGFTYPHVLQP